MTERQRTAFTLRQSGMKFADIGKAMGGVTAVAARTLYLRAAEKYETEIAKDSIYNDIAYSIFITEVKAYRTAILAGDHNDIEATGEAIREAIVRALKGNASPIRLDNDTCGNG